LTIIMTPDWQLPPGTDRGLWDYLHNEHLARGYDEALADTALLEIDRRFTERYFENPGRLIDLGCGTGRLLVLFARRGFECVGVDLSDGMLAVAREKVERAGVQVELRKANLVELDGFASASFDYAACLFSTFGMIRGREHRRRMLGHVRRILKPSGWFVLHVHNRGFVSWNSFPTGDRTAPQHHGGAPLTLHHFTKREIRRDLKEAGFHPMCIEPIGAGPDGRPPLPSFLPGLRAYGYLIAAQ
jgi:ubiquinone/menaquinone biosynthesis C-methylase UbiE